MRVKINLKAKGSFIPFNYNQFIHAMILQKLSIADPEYAQEIHDSRSFKFFTFSELMIPRGRANREKGGLEVFSDTISLFVSSPRDRFLKAFLSGLMRDPLAVIWQNKLELESVETLEQPDFSAGIAYFKTISPIVVSTVREEGGKLKSRDLFFHEGKFYSNIEKNLLRKWKEFHGKEFSGQGIELKVLGGVRTRRIKIKEEYHRGSMMRFTATGAPELLGFAYECGFGERNSMGFGMVRGE